MVQEAAPAAATGAPRAEGFDLDLADAACAWITDSVLLMTLADGSLIMLTMHVESGTVRRIKVHAHEMGLAVVVPCLTGCRLPWQVHTMPWDCCD